MAKDDKRIDQLEKAVAKTEKKRRKLKARVEALEEVVAELTEGEVGADPGTEDTAGLEEAGPDDSAQVDAVADPEPTGRPALSEPDESWTVARLREAATSRGLTGTSRMTKAELLAAVSEAGHRA